MKKRAGKRFWKGFFLISLLFVLIIGIIWLSGLFKKEVLEKNESILQAGPIEDEISLPSEPLFGYYLSGMAYILKKDFGQGIPGVTEIPAKVTFYDKDWKIEKTLNTHIYDDSMHNDGNAGDGNFANSLLLDTSLPEGKHHIASDLGCFPATSSCGFYGTIYDYFELSYYIPGECKEFAPGKNSLQEKRMNLIFMANKWGLWSADKSVFYPNWQTFFGFINGLNFDTSAPFYSKDFDTLPAFFNLPPFKDYKDKFNVWYINPMYTGSLSPTGNSGFFIKYMISRCPFDGEYVILDPDLALEGGIQGLGGKPIRVLMPYSPRTLTHELGHNIGDEGDEYMPWTCGKDSSYTKPSNEIYGKQDSPNVYHASSETNTDMECKKYANWQPLVGSCYGDKLYFDQCPWTYADWEISCYNGAMCTDSAYLWRPALNTLFNRNYMPSAVDITAFCRKLIEVTGETKGICKSICVQGCSKEYFCKDVNKDSVGECCKNIGGSWQCPSLSQACTDGDSDSDGICNGVDNCPSMSNSGQGDFDKDSIGDVCDNDADADGDLKVNDCDDLNPNRFHGNKEICTMPGDEDCDSGNDVCLTCEDFDGDGYGKNCPLGNDCNDDMGDDPKDIECPKQESSNLIKCNEKTSKCAFCIHPGVEEMCDGVNNNCDANGLVDESPTGQPLSRECGSSIGECRIGEEKCMNGKWSGLCEGGVNPVPEICDPVTWKDKDGLDRDCDGTIMCACSTSDLHWSKNVINDGESVSLIYAPDRDKCPQLGFQQYDIKIYARGKTNIEGEFTNIPAKFPSVQLWYSVTCDRGICKSSQYYFTVNPLYDSAISESNDLTILFSKCDADGDLYVKQECIPPIYDTSVYDCNDDPAIGKDIHPGVVELCNEIDDNCNGMNDEPYNIYYRDADGDLYGDISNTAKVCSASAPFGFVTNYNDCDDTPGSGFNVHPGALEICDGKDNNCINGIDENKPYCISGSCVQCLQDSDCSNNLYCDGLEKCVSGTCQKGVALNVNDNIACTIDSCDEINDKIVHASNNALCQNGLYCDGPEYCDATIGCVRGIGSIPNCNDGVACTKDECKEGADLTDNAGYCASDTSACQCNFDTDCSDNNACTDDACECIDDLCSSKKCQNTIDDTNTCNDGIYCTANDKCSAGACIGTSRNVNDNIVCTIDLCDEINDKILNIPDNNACDNKLYCDGSEYCDTLSGCKTIIESTPTCNDNNACTMDSCDRTIDSCTYTPIDNDKDTYSICAGDGQDCNDNNPAIYPNAPELCDNADNQCPNDIGYGKKDEGCSCTDLKGFACKEGEICPGQEIKGDGSLTNCCSVQCTQPSWSRCTDCGNGLFNWCDRAECYGISEKCYFTDNAFPIADSCVACTAQTSCAIYDSDSTSCQDNVCGLNSCSFDNTNKKCVDACIDKDSDGYGLNCIKGSDCNDNNPAIYPNAPELCDDIDNQCPNNAGYGTIDENCADTTPLIISNIINSSITNQSAIITWQINGNSNGRVYYGLTTTLGLNVVDNNYLTSHSLQLNDLKNDSVYYYKVESCDVSNNCINSSLFDFRTLAGAYIDNEAPVIALGMPINNSIANSNSITFTYTPSDYSSITNCTLFVGIETRVDFEIENNIENNFVLNLPNGNYVWDISCTDSRGNVGISESRNLNVNYQAPINPPAGDGSGSGGGGGFPPTKPKPKAENMTNISIIGEKEKIILGDELNFIDVSKGEEKVLVDLYGNSYLVSFILTEDGKIVAKLFNGDYIIPREDILPIALGNSEMYVGVVTSDIGRAKVVLGLDASAVKEKVGKVEGGGVIEEGRKFKGLYYALIGVVAVLVFVIIALVIWYFVGKREVGWKVGGIERFK